MEIVLTGGYQCCMPHLTVQHGICVPTLVSLMHTQLLHVQEDKLQVQKHR